MKPASIIETQGTKGTTVCNLGGVGIGYKLNEHVYISGGNGFYYDETSRIKKFYPDNGKNYLGAVKDFSFAKTLI